MALLKLILSYILNWLNIIKYLSILWRTYIKSVLFLKIRFNLLNYIHAMEIHILNNIMIVKSLLIVYYYILTFWL
jgi:hypothetical protein